MSQPVIFPATAYVRSLYLDFDAFFAHVEKQLDPALHERCVLVTPMKSRHSSVIACCYTSKARGVRRGMKREEIDALVPDGVFRQARHEVYVALHHRIIDVIERFLPVRKAWSIDEMECDLKRMRAQEAYALAEKIRDAIEAEIGPIITPSIGLASNQLLAKIAAEMHKPRGLIVLEPEQMPAKIHGVPLGDIPGVASGMLARLERAGVRTMPELLALAPKQARAIWGSVEGERMWRALHGETVEKPPTKRSMFGHSRVLARGWQTPGKAGECLRLLTAKAARRLREDQSYATRLTVSFKDFHDQRFKVEREFPALRDDFNLLRVMGETYERALRQSGTRKLKSVAVLLHGLQKREEMTGDLFAPPLNTAKQEAATDAMDALNARFGGDMLHLGMRAELPGGYAGAKIAFGRIPSRADLGQAENAEVNAARAKRAAPRRGLAV